MAGLYHLRGLSRRGDERDMHHYYTTVPLLLPSLDEHFLLKLSYLASPRCHTWCLVSRSVLPLGRMSRVLLIYPTGVVVVN